MCRFCLCRNTVSCASEKSLRKAFEWFDRKVSDYVAKTAGDKGTALASFVENLSDKLFFTVITVTDELNAFKVFETLNSRGVRLSATDLLKNYLFSVLHSKGDQHEHEMKALDDRWESIVGRLGSESFPDFLRIHWNSRNPLVRQTELFKTIRVHVDTREKAFELIRQMEVDVETYLSLTQPEATNVTSPLVDQVSTLRLFGVTQPFPLLLAAKRISSMSQADYEQIVRACAIVSVRYNVIGSLSPSEQESTYNAAAVKIARGELKTPSAIIRALAPIYPSDANFKTAFAEKSISTNTTRKRRIVRYLLCKIEEKLSGGVAPDFESDAFNLEHVLPLNPELDWDTFPAETSESFVYRLGNMALICASANRDAGNLDYAKKRLAYSASACDNSKDCRRPRRMDSRANRLAPTMDGEPGDGDLAARSPFVIANAPSVLESKSLAAKPLFP